MLVLAVMVILSCVSSDGQVIRWSLNLDDLLAQGCEWLQDYFVTHPAVHDNLKVCDRN